jgi:F420H(2)-dependent quinone reductase
MTAPKRPQQLDSPLLPVIFRHMSRAQVWVYRKTNGRIGGKWRIGAGFRKPVPTLLLEHRGRKSGKLFTVPSGAACGRGWSGSTRTSTPIRVGPNARFRS